MNVQGKVIALEEHFWIPELSVAGNYPAEWARRLLDLNTLRLEEMNAAGIDIQVISHGPSKLQNLDAASAIDLARRANDVLQQAVLAHPDRFSAFALLPTPDPQAAANELERCVTENDFKGAMIHGTTHGEFIDRKRFWPIFERAEALDVPIYIHPGATHPAVAEAYYKDYPAMASAGWGFNVETATHAIRLILSGVLDQYPKLRIIIGHMGEGLPFSLWRCDALLTRDSDLKKRFREYFRENFFITTSGNFSVPALLCSVMEVGADKILFSIDWPYADNVEGKAFLDNAPISVDDRDKILSSNAATLLRL
jgi:predicted TIM-barrel fold metal-dependent hydrolase